MAASTARRGYPDHNVVARGQGYEISYFARKHGISMKQERELIDQVGNDRAKLNETARSPKKR